MTPPNSTDDILLIDCEKRLLSIEDRAKKTDNVMNLASLKWKSDMDDAERQITVIREEITQIRDDFKKTVADFLDMIEFFRGCTTREDFDKVKRRIDDWKPEGYVSQDEFKRLARGIVREL